MKITNVVITTLFNDCEYKSGLKTSHGISCLVETLFLGKQQNILFDTGGDGQVLLSNIKALGLYTNDIQNVFLSHIHSDHVGGLPQILKKNKNVKVFIPASFPDSIKQTIESFLVEYKEIDENEAIFESVYSTGQMGMDVVEQSLVLDTIKGLVIISGCAHPGIVNIVKKAKEMLPDNKVYLVMGGFHLKDSEKVEIENIIQSFKKLGVEKVAPSHCSGGLARELFKKGYGENYIENGVGGIIEI